MSFDLYQAETNDRIAKMPGVRESEVGTWDGFVRGAALTTMRGLARTARAIDLVGSVGPIAQDAITGGTEAQDRYFREHDEIWGSAVDYWTSKPNEVGIAGQIVGELATLIPMVIASPSLAIATTQLGVGEELVKKGVSAEKAQLVGGAQAAGLGLGIWMPVLGQNLWQRVVVGGAGFNVLQGAAMRGAGEVVLRGTPAEGEFKAFDGMALTLDVLLGMAFGTISHLSPDQRAQGATAWKRIGEWADSRNPTEKAAIQVLRQAQHMNVDSAPGIPVGQQDIEAHVNRMRTALEQMERNQPVEVSDLPQPRMEVDPAEARERERLGGALLDEAERARKIERLPVLPDIAEPAPATTESEAPAAMRGEAEPPPPRGPRGAEAAGVEDTQMSPLALEADRIVSQRPDMPIRIGTDAEGKPIITTAKRFLEDARAEADDARADVKLFEAAARCLFGRA